MQTNFTQTTRVQVVQELCLPETNEITVFCGNDKIPWGKLAAIDNAIARYGWAMHVHEAPSQVKAMVKLMAGELTLEHTRSMLKSINGRNKPELSTLLANLWTFRDRACGNSKDKIYSVKHICRDTTAIALRVDYGITTVQAFTDVARKIINDTKRLYIFGACQPTNNYVDLPSWVPDWTVGREHRPLK